MSLVPALSQMDLVHTLILHVLKISSNILLLFVHWSSMLSIPFRLLFQNFAGILYVSHYYGVGWCSLNSEYQ
jgi:hypothetical protein